MTAQAAQAPSIVAAAPVYNVAGAADTFPAQVGGRYLIHVKNANAGAVAVVIDDPNSIAPAQNTQFNPDVTVSVPTGAERVIQIEANRFRNPATGNVGITFTPNASVTYAIYGPL